MNAVEHYVYKMKIQLKKNGVNLKLCLEENKKINAAIAIAANLLDENDQQNEIDVLKDHLNELNSMYLLAS